MKSTLRELNPSLLATLRGCIYINTTEMSVKIIKDNDSNGISMDRTIESDAFERTFF